MSWYSSSVAFVLKKIDSEMGLWEGGCMLKGSLPVADAVYECEVDFLTCMNVKGYVIASLCKLMLYISWTIGGSLACGYHLWMVATSNESLIASVNVEATVVRHGNTFMAKYFRVFKSITC